MKRFYLFLFRTKKAEKARRPKKKRTEPRSLQPKVLMTTKPRRKRAKGAKVRLLLRRPPPKMRRRE